MTGSNLMFYTFLLLYACIKTCSVNYILTSICCLHGYVYVKCGCESHLLPNRFIPILKQHSQDWAHWSISPSNGGHALPLEVCLQNLVPQKSKNKFPGGSIPILLHSVQKVSMNSVPMLWPSSFSILAMPL